MIDVTFKLPEAGAMMKKLGLDQRGEVQRVIAEEALGLCDSIVPFRSGMLKQSGHVENNGECIVWNQPYDGISIMECSWLTLSTRKVLCSILIMAFGADRVCKKSLQISLWNIMGKANPTGLTRQCRTEGGRSLSR